MWKKSYLSHSWFKNLFFPSTHCWLFSLNTKWFYLLGHHWPPPRGLKIAKCLFSGSFQESHFRSDLHVGCHPEKCYIGFLSRFFFGVTLGVGKSGKKLGQKVNVKFFIFFSYTLGNRIPRAFQNLSDLHVRCHREKFYIGFLSQIFFIYMWGSQEKNLGQKVNVKFFRGDPYTLGNRIPRAFQNLSDLHVRCHREKFYIGFLSQIFFGSHYTCGGVRKKIWGKKSMENFSG